VAASVFGAIAFLGGGLGLSGVPGTLVLIGISCLMATVMIWAKWTFPRMRPDQLMSFAWKVLTPMALVQLAIVGVIAVWL
jgi:NADH-quinone oxidoreductase subunit H